GAGMRREPSVRTGWNRQVRMMSVLGGVLAFGMIMLVMQLLRDAEAGSSVTEISPMGVATLFALGGTAALACATVSAVSRRVETSIGGGVGGVELYDLASAPRPRNPPRVPRDR